MTQGHSLRRQIATKLAPQPGAPYSQAMAAGGLIFVSGQRPQDPSSGQIPSSFEAQVHQVLRNLAAVLEGAGATLDDVVKVTAHLSDLALFDDFNQVYRQYFNPPYPARTTVGSQLRGILVELDVIAVDRSRMS
ncbi:MAG: RidA family protein [Aggregatilineales bacterium]